MSYVLRIVGLLSLLSLVSIGCSQNGDLSAEPILIYITATPRTPASVTPSPSATVPPGQAAPVTVLPETPTATATETATAVTSPSPLPPFPTSTITPTPLVSSTPLPPSETPTPEPPVVVDNIPAADNLPVFQSGQMGLQIHPFITLDEWDVMLRHAQSLGVEWIKIQLRWAELEPQPGQYSPLMDQYVLQIQRSGYQIGKRFQVMLSIVDAPLWARTPEADPNLHAPPADPQAYANFLRAFLSRFGTDDPTIDAIEVWNEPNLLREWSGMEMSGRRYMDLFRAAYTAIKETRSYVTVVTAGLAPVGDGVPGAVGDRTFLQQMYDAGLNDFPDIKIGAHPYGWANPPEATCCTRERGWADNRVFYFKDTLDDYINIMRRNGDEDGKLWVTEFGWGTYRAIGGGGSDANPPAVAEFFNLNSPEQQAEYTLRALEMMQQPPYNEVVELAFLWNLNFAMVGDIFTTPIEQAGYSLLNTVGEPRLVYRYLERARKIPVEQP